jgi:hypothetical protein
MELPLSEDAVRILSEQEDPGEYISEAIKYRGWLLHSSIEDLRAAGWLSNEVSAIIEATNGGWQYGPPKVLASEMTDRAHYATEWDVDASRWQELITTILKDSEKAFALWIVVSEFWSGNTVAKQLVEGLEGR